MTKYEEQKNRVILKAIMWQMDTTPKSWGQLAEEVAQFAKLAKRYGLIKEFKENGII